MGIVNLKLDDELHQAFRKATVARETTMQDELEAFVRTWLGADLPKHLKEKLERS